MPPTGEALEPASDAPRLLGAPDGDFQLIARVTVGFNGAFDAGVLYVHVGERAWAKLCLENSPGRAHRLHGGHPGALRRLQLLHGGGSSVWLRVSRTGRAFAFHASLDGERWTFVRLFTPGRREGDRRGAGRLPGAGADGEGCVVTYDHLEFRPAWPADLRDGV